MKTRRSSVLPGLFLPILLLIAPAAFGAEEGVEYNVQKGDTLWEISESKLKDPLFWPKLWKANPHIRNPHLIFPSEKVFIPSELLREAGITPAEAAAAEGEPARPRLEPAKRLVVPESTARTVPQVTRGTIVTRETLHRSGYIISELNPAGFIAGSPQDAYVYGRGDVVYIGSRSTALPDTKFYVIAEPRKLLHPRNDRQVVGYLVWIKGVVQVIGDEFGKSKAVVTESHTEFKKGEMLIPYYPISLPVAPAIERRPQSRGTIVAVWEERLTGGRSDVVYIDKGSAHGVEIGDLFEVQSDAAMRPVIGTIQVFATSPGASAAIIKEAVMEVRPGDTFRN